VTRALQRYATTEQEVLLHGRRVRLVRPSSADALLERAVARGAGDPPYWAELWPSALVLADELAATDLRDRRVLELGCGLGLPAVAAALSGATVLATDSSRDALAFAAENGRRALGRRLPTLQVDLLAPPEALLAAGPFDLVVAADVLYRPELVEALAALLPQLCDSAGEALLAVPWRDQERPLVDALRKCGWSVSSEERPSATGRPGSSARLVRLTPPRATAPGSGT